MKETRFIGVLLFFLLLTSPEIVSAGQHWNWPSENIILPKDSDEVEDNPFIDRNAIKRAPTDSVREKNTPEYREFTKHRGYVMDRRYLAMGDSTDRRWYDNFFLQAGAGLEQMAPPGSNYHFDALTTAHLGFGIELNRLSAIRLMLHGGLGYQQDYDRMFARLGARVDYLFDMSSYISGYRPNRLASISTIVGFGGQYARLNNMSPRRDGTSWEGHGGLQLRFYTGPHGYVNLEPYIGVATDNYDLSRSQNWHRYDVFYGANLNYVYYFTNHLTREARRREIKKLKDEEPVVLADLYQAENDTVLSSWQAPWFVEFSLGANMSDNTDSGIAKTLGPAATVSIGKWFSPVIGLRASAVMRSTTWQENNTSTPAVKMNSQYVSGGLEAMFNPFGLSKSFRWNQSAGAYLLAGGEYGWLIKYQNGKSLHCRSEAYTAGVHLWLRLTDGIRLFIEPRFMHNVYKIPYSNVSWNHKFSDNSYGLNIGMTATQIAKEFRKTEDSAMDEEMRSFTVGLGGGVNIVQKLSSMDAGKTFPLSVNGYGLYRFDHCSGIRLGLDYLVVPSVGRSSYTDYNMDVPDMGYAPVVRQGQWNHAYYIGQATLGYNLNMTNFFAGYRPGRRFQLEGYLGCGVACLFGEGGTLDEAEQLREGHEVRLVEKAETTTLFSVAGGMALSYRLSPSISLSLMPQISYIPRLSLPAVNQSRLKVIESINLGVQYHF